MQLPAAGQIHVDLCHLLLDLSVLSRGLHVLEYNFFVNFSCFSFDSRFYMTPANARAEVLIGVHAHLLCLSFYLLYLCRVLNCPPLAAHLITVQLRGQGVMKIQE